MPIPNDPLEAIKRFLSNPGEVDFKIKTVERYYEFIEKFKRKDSAVNWGIFYVLNATHFEKPVESMWKSVGIMEKAN